MEHGHLRGGVGVSRVLGGDEAQENLSRGARLLVDALDTHPELDHHAKLLRVGKHRVVQTSHQGNGDVRVLDLLSHLRSVARHHVDQVGAFRGRLAESLDRSLRASGPLRELLPAKQHLEALPGRRHIQRGFDRILGVHRVVGARARVVRTGSRTRGAPRGERVGEKSFRQSLVGRISRHHPSRH